MPAHMDRAGARGGHGNAPGIDHGTGRLSEIGGGMPGGRLGAWGGVALGVGGDSEPDGKARRVRGRIGASGFEPEFSRSQSARVKPGYATPRSEHSTCDHCVMPIVIAATILVTAAALLAFRWFHQYRYTEAWRKSEFRGAAFGMLMWFGGIFGHRAPPPPQAKVEFASGRAVADPPTEPTASGGPPLPQDTPDDKQ